MTERSRRSVGQCFHLQVPRVLEYQITARIRDNAANHGAPSATVLTNSVAANFDILFSDGATKSFSDTKTATTTVTEPNLAITKDITPAVGDAGDTVTITLTVRNNGDGPAREVTVTDLVNDTDNDGDVDASDTKVYDCAITPNAPPAGWTYSLTGADPACQVNYTSSSGSGDIPAGENRVFTFTATISQQVVTGTVYTNTGKTNAHSLNHDDTGGFNNPLYDADNRTQYSATDDDTVNINDASASSKTIISTSESFTDDSNLNSNPPVAVGEVVELEIRFVFPEGTTTNVRLYDRLQKLPLSSTGAVWGRFVSGPLIYPKHQYLSAVLPIRAILTEALSILRFPYPMSIFLRQTISDSELKIIGIFILILIQLPILIPTILRKKRTSSL